MENARSHANMSALYHITPIVVSSQMVDVALVIAMLIRPVAAARLLTCGVAIVVVFIFAPERGVLGPSLQRPQVGAA